MGDWIDEAVGARVVDLAHPIERGMPVSPNHPGFEYAMMRRHGDMVRADGGSAANDLFVLGGHVGTHIDALGHVSQDGVLYEGHDAVAASTNGGLTALGIDTVDPIVCRGVLLDIAAVRNVDVLDAGAEVTVADLEAAQSASGVTVGRGDAVLIHTGWATHWADTDLFRGNVSGAPGIGEAGARWLADKEVRLVGGETIAFERIEPGNGHAALPVHRIFLVETGIHIVEVMNLSALAEARAQSFLFVLAPLKIKGATGSPARPIALLP